MNEFPFRRVLSLEPLVDHWREALSAASGVQARVAGEIVAAVERVPELLGPVGDASVLEGHEDLVAALMGAVFAPAGTAESYGVALLPFDSRRIWATPAFERMGLHERLRDLIEGGAMTRHRAIGAYQFIISSLYGAELDVVVPFELVAADQETGLDRHFQLTVDARFARVVVTGPKPELSRDEIDQLLADRTNLELWAHKLPPELFEIHGLTVFHAADVTEKQVMAALTSDLLSPESMASIETVDRLQSRLRALLRRPQLELGLICVRRDDQDSITGAVRIGRSLLLSEGYAPVCENECDSYYSWVIENRKPWFVRDLSRVTIPSQFERHVLDQGIRNILIAPLEIGDRLVGLIELGSPNPGDIHVFNTAHIPEVLGLFAIAMKRMLDDRETRMQAVIKQQYTAIHPAVEWRFRNAARNYIDATDSGQYAQPEAIVFKDVYPLYGLSDVRGSSLLRAEAIQADLLEQLGLARDVVVAANRARDLPVLAGIEHRIAGFAADVSHGLRAGDEVRVLDFLMTELEDVFRQIEEFGEATTRQIGRYREALDPALGFLYRRRRDFDESVTLLSDSIGAYIDREEERAQQMFPHYFERYTTDGVDYNIYVGASLQEDGGFQPIYLRNLRIWQLMMMCGVVWELKRNEPKLAVPLEVAHLILVHSAPLSIRFRSEEKQFDVDGAYNIRYEIVKKRIDKARIRGSREQLTQPGRLAIVYSRRREADEYREYISFLQASGFLTADVEEVEIEDLQGASGLRALRVAVAPEPTPVAQRATIEDVERLTRELATIRT